MWNGETHPFKETPIWIYRMWTCFSRKFRHDVFFLEKMGTSESTNIDQNAREKHRQGNHRPFQVMKKNPPGQPTKQWGFPTICRLMSKDIHWDIPIESDLPFLFMQGSLYHQPKQYTFTGKFPQSYHKICIVWSSQNFKFNDPVLCFPKAVSKKNKHHPHPISGIFRDPQKNMGPLSHTKHPRKLTWNPQIMIWKMCSLFQWAIFRFHV